MTILRLHPGNLRLLLVGGGHAHLEVLYRLAREPLGISLALVSPSRRHHYSGMVPGYLQGTYREEEMSVDVVRLVERAGGKFVQGTGAGITPARQIVTLEDGQELGYDLVSFDVGSDSAGAADPQVVDYARRIKPLSRVVALRQRLLNLVRGEPESGERRVVVVGGGAAGVEVAFAIARVLDEAPGGQAAPRRVTIVDSGTEILPGFNDRFRTLARQLLAARRIEVRNGVRAVAVHPQSVDLADGSALAADLTVWLTGAVGFPIFEGAGLPLDSRGFLLIDDALRSVVDPRVFAAGDCATMVSYPDTPKAGVYAVRQAPILWSALKAALESRRPLGYRPQTDFLRLLNTADGSALLQFKGYVAHSPWAFWWKDRLDRAFLLRYQR